MSTSRLSQAVRLGRLTVFLMLLASCSLSGCINKTVYRNVDRGVEAVYPANWVLEDESERRIKWRTPLQTPLGEASVGIEWDFIVPASSSPEEAIRTELEATVYPAPDEFGRPLSVNYGESVSTTTGSREITASCAEAFFPARLLICLVVVREENRTVLLKAGGNEPAVELALKTLITGLRFIETETPAGPSD